MDLIQQITSDSLQAQRVVLADGTFFDITINFKPMQLGWYIQEITYGDFTLHGMRICISPNMFYQFKNQLPFGIACLSVDSREPTLQDDFSSGNVNLYLLSKAEVNQFSEYLSG